MAKYNNKIVGQVGIDQRAIVSKKFGLIHIFGIVDFCVTSALRGHGIGALLLKNIEKLARQSDSIDCLMLFADDQRLYTKFGFYNSDIKCKFLAMDDLNSVYLLEKDMKSSLMIKNIKADVLKRWSDRYARSCVLSIKRVKFTKYDQLIFQRILKTYVQSLIFFSYHSVYNAL